VTEYVIRLVIESKDETTAEGVRPALPTGAELCAVARDELGYLTKRDAGFGWRITEVTM
jgi:hypothetical protein